MAYFPSNPLIAQSDKTVLLEVNKPLSDEARDTLARFAELEKSPEHIHTYRITPLSLWNAAAAGLDAASIVGGLERFGKYELPGNVRADIVSMRLHATGGSSWSRKASTCCWSPKIGRCSSRSSATSTSPHA